MHRILDNSRDEEAITEVEKEKLYQKVALLPPRSSASVKPFPHKLCAIIVVEKVIVVNYPSWTQVHRSRDSPTLPPEPWISDRVEMHDVLVRRMERPTVISRAMDSKDDCRCCQQHGATYLKSVLGGRPVQLMAWSLGETWGAQIFPCKGRE